SARRRCALSPGGRQGRLADRLRRRPQAQALPARSGVGRLPGCRGPPVLRSAPGRAVGGRPYGEGMAMRFELRARPGRREFWVSGVPEDLQPALEHIWAGGRHGEGWCKSFDQAAYRTDEAFANLQRLLVPALRQVAGLDPVPWADALAETCRRLTPAGGDWWLAGSAAPAVRGAPLIPGDLDLIVAGPDAPRTGD